jgi:creatinine amidohydrolase
MTKVEYELMTPREALDARRRCPAAFVPVSPLEWHGPHLPLGTDALHARHVAVELARELGGVVLPALFAGTETVRPPGSGAQQLGPLGLPKDARVVGMDFPRNPVKSVYFEESAFGVAVRDVVRALKEDSFRLVALVNGHGAVNHRRTLDRIAREETLLPELCVLDLFVWLEPPPPLQGPGHADREETAIMLAIAGELVQLDDLPPPETPLRYAAYGIVDAAAFDGSPNAGFVVPPEADPRRATREQGEEILRREVEAAAGRVRRELERLGAQIRPRLEEGSTP